MERDTLLRFPQPPKSPPMNEELRVPTIPLEAEIRYANGQLMTGRIFLPARAIHHTGAMRPDEWINQSSTFFPFVVAAEKGARILNKKYVVVLTVPAQHDEIDLIEELGVARRVHVECGGTAVEGIVHVNMPDTQSRVLDWVNRPEPFLLVRESNRWHIVQKNRITMLTELGD
ncbi:MAG TPA: hypothetical protein VFL80_00445 [Thermoanaerobaculia bacterium]|nr:hypothetical protein [Thermoanaerobaculia bacterium]